MQKIGFVLCPSLLSTSITLPIEMLKAAESIARARAGQSSQFEIAFLSTDLTPVETRAGFPITPTHTLDEYTDADLIFLPALWRNPRPIIRKNQPLIQWLKKSYENGATITAVGTGVCLLADAGLLNGKPATTHWHYFDQFQRDYPQVELKRQYFITQSGNVYCAASVNALADLTVHFIERFFNRDIANHVERNFSHEIRQSYERSGFFEGRVNQHPDEDIVQSQVWLQDNYGKDIKLSEVAERFEMSVRTFNRRFKAATGKSPLQYLQEIRIEIAKDLLKTSNLSISEIAFKVGYSDMGHFTGLFKKFMAVTPSEYRTTVRAKLFCAEA